MSVPGALPALYRKIELLDRRRHVSLRLRDLPNHRFAAGVNLVPLTLPEFAEASRALPIVFLRTEGRLGAALVTGVKAGVNAALDNEGRWREGLYLPAYVRRYPFILVGESEPFRIGVDVEAPHLSKTEGEALFNSSGDAAAMRRVQALCAAFDAAWRQTQAFLTALDTAGLLVPGEVTIRDGETQLARFGGFEVIDEARLRGLEAKLLAEWFRSGWLGAIEMQRASSSRWAALHALS